MISSAANRTTLKTKAGTSVWPWASGPKGTLAQGLRVAGRAVLSLANAWGWSSEEAQQLPGLSLSRALHTICWNEPLG